MAGVLTSWGLSFFEYHHTIICSSFVHNVTPLTNQTLAVFYQRCTTFFLMTHKHTHILGLLSSSYLPFIPNDIETIRANFTKMERMFVEFNHLIFKIEHFRYDSITSINDSSDNNVAAEI